MAYRPRKLPSDLHAKFNEGHINAPNKKTPCSKPYCIPHNNQNTIFLNKKSVFWKERDIYGPRRIQVDINAIPYLMKVGEKWARVNINKKIHVFVRSDGIYTSMDRTTNYVGNYYEGKITGYTDKFITLSYKPIYEYYINPY